MRRSECYISDVACNLLEGGFQGGSKGGEGYSARVIKHVRMFSQILTVDRDHPSVRLHSPLKVAVRDGRSFTAVVADVQLVMLVSAGGVMSWRLVERAR